MAAQGAQEKRNRERQRQVSGLMAIEVVDDREGEVRTGFSALQNSIRSRARASAIRMGETIYGGSTLAICSPTSRSISASSRLAGGRGPARSTASTQRRLAWASDCTRALA